MADQASGFTKMLFSPPVIIGGVAIGAFLLLMNSGNSQAQTGGAVGPNAAQLGAVVQLNQVAANNQAQLAQISAQSGAATLSANVQEQGQILSFLSNLAGFNANVNNTIITSQAGVTNASIASSTAVALDVNNNMERLNQAYVEANTAQQVAFDQLQGVQAQAKAAQNISLINGITGLIGGGIKAATAMVNPVAAGLNAITPGSGPGVFSSVAQSSVPF